MACKGKKKKKHRENKSELPHPCFIKDATATNSFV